MSVLMDMGPPAASFANRSNIARAARLTLTCSTKGAATDIVCRQDFRKSDLLSQHIFAGPQIIGNGRLLFPLF